MHIVCLATVSCSLRSYVRYRFSVYSCISVLVKSNFGGKDTYLLMGWNISNIRIWYMAL